MAPFCIDVALNARQIESTFRGVAEFEEAVLGLDTFWVEPILCAHTLSAYAGGSVSRVLASGWVFVKEQGGSPSSRRELAIKTKSGKLVF